MSDGIRKSNKQKEGSNTRRKKSNYKDSINSYSKGIKIHKTPFKTILMIILCTIFTSTGQVFWKLGSSSIANVSSFILNPFLIVGFIFYGLGALLLIISLKYGELSVVYPFIALSFVWVNIFSIFIFDETISIINWLGILSILFGISFIGYGSGK